MAKRLLHGDRRVDGSRKGLPNGELGVLQLDYSVSQCSRQRVSLLSHAIQSGRRDRDLMHVQYRIRRICHDNHNLLPIVLIDRAATTWLSGAICFGLVAAATAQRPDDPMAALAGRFERLKATHYRYSCSFTYRDPLMPKFLIDKRIRLPSVGRGTGTLDIRTDGSTTVLDGTYPIWSTKAGAKLIPYHFCELFGPDWQGQALYNGAEEKPRWVKFTRPAESPAITGQWSLSVNNFLQPDSLCVLAGRLPDLFGLEKKISTTAEGFNVSFSSLGPPPDYPVLGKIFSVPVKWIFDYDGTTLLPKKVWMGQVSQFADVFDFPFHTWKIESVTSYQGLEIPKEVVFEAHPSKDKPPRTVIAYHLELVEPVAPPLTLPIPLGTTVMDGRRTVFDGDSVMLAKNSPDTTNYFWNGKLADWRQFTPAPESLKPAGLSAAALVLLSTPFFLVGLGLAGRSALTRRRRRIQ